MKKNVREVGGRARRFSLSMADWDTYNMVKGLINMFETEKGMDVEAAYKTARGIMSAVSFGPAVNVATGNEGGVVVESKDGALTVIGCIDFTDGNGPTARRVLEEEKPTFHIYR
jgi:hypothetical protein